jgi:energy-coupling factor transporter ATP-binding protein EcfA2
MHEGGGYYLGARYYKCDLHMHTPADAQSWREASTRVTCDTSDERRAKIARQYLSRCHVVGLEMIGITDHNFAPTPQKSFINDLRKANDEVARELGRAPLIILPGFEIEANVGKGCHVLCLFPEGTDLHLIESRLTSCGLPWDSRFDTKGRPKQSKACLADIIEVVQKARDHAGLVICAHPLTGKGILADENLEMWLQQEEFKNPDLLCIEVPRPVDELSDGIRKLIVGGDECSPEWRRGIGDGERPIAYVCSSDCHRLEPTEEDPSNYIGFRHTWVKMSDPGIEALRQAFLDRASRIRVGADNPEDDYEHPRITRVEVTGATFYKAEPICFSPNLNCIIGSRGSGKSTLVDYIRLALGRLRDDDLPRRLRDDIMDRINNTLNDDSVITVDFETSGVPYRVEYEHKDDGQWKISRLDTGEQNPDWSIRMLFPIRALSQREIDESVERSDQTFLAKLLDEFIVNTLEELNQQETELRSQIEALELQIRTKKDAQQRRAGLVTNQAEIQGRITRLDAVRKPLERWTSVDECSNYLKALLQGCDDFVGEAKNHANMSYENLAAIASRIPENAETLFSSNDVTDPTEVDPGGADGHAVMKKISAIVSEAHTIVQHALGEYQQAINDTIKAFERATCGESGPLKSLLEARWNPLYTEEVAEYERLSKSLEETGDDPEEYLSLKDQLKTILASLKQLDVESQEIDELERKREKSLTELRKVWHQQTETRRHKAQELMERLRPGPDAKPLVRIEITHQEDRKSILQNWSSRLKDRRRVNENDIMTLIDFVQQQPVESGATIPERMIRLIRAKGTSSQLESVLGTRTKAFLDIFNEDVLPDLETKRINDKVEYKVYRQDGSLAGPIEGVSVGQKGLAFLNVLLAAGDVPILVDTPEEGLDSEGVYGELVPVFRREKERRQLIIATHNANIPVNADAELVVTLEAIGLVDFSKPDLECMFSADQVAAGLDRGSEEYKSEAHIKKSLPKMPNLESLSIRVRSEHWHSDVRKYLIESRGWNAEEADPFIRLITAHREVCGGTRRRRGKGGRMNEAIGALDNPEVKLAVQDIMEGSEQAFRKRWEKYGF